MYRMRPYLMERTSMWNIATIRILRRQKNTGKSIDT